jgi:hypothetical protein
VPFVLPKRDGGEPWRALVDTGKPEDEPREIAGGAKPLEVAGRSLLLLM